MHGTQYANTDFAQDGFDINVKDGELLVTFAITAEDAKFGVGSAAFLLSVVDNVILTGPHEIFETDVCESTKKSERVWQGATVWKRMYDSKLLQNKSAYSCKMITKKSILCKCI